jgi:hypothetical protein
VGDSTEAPRRARLAELQAEVREIAVASAAAGGEAARPDVRAGLEARHGRVWDTEELAAEFEVIGFMAPLVAVRRRADGKPGSVEFAHHPRFYFNFEPHEP